MTEITIVARVCVTDGMLPTTITGVWVRVYDLYFYRGMICVAKRRRLGGFVSDILQSQSMLGVLM
jgi:hypothetical protein